MAEAKTMREALDDWTCEDAEAAGAQAAKSLAGKRLDERAEIRAILYPLAKLYAESLAAENIAVVRRVLDDLGALDMSAADPRVKVGRLAAALAAQQAVADLDLVFLDNDDFDDAVLEGYDERACRQAIGL